MIAVIKSGDGLIVPVLAQPSAKRNAVLGERNGALRVAVTAPPERGAANEAVRSVLAEALKLPASRIALISGAASRRKRFQIDGLALAELQERLNQLAARSSSDSKAIGEG